MEELLKHLDNNYDTFDPESSVLELDSEVLPNDYLEFARKDLNSGVSAHSRINAYSNAKRALHFQIDLLLDAFGIGSSKNIGFPRKLELCKKIGISTPKILHKINHLRNKIEHHYIIPELSEVEDAIDIVELFLDSTVRFFKHFPDNIVFPDIDAEIFGYSGIYNVKLVKNKGEIVILMNDDADNESRKSYLAPSDEFFAWLYFIIHCTK